MILVIAEKSIAGQRISSLLAGKNIAPTSQKGATTFLFECNGKQFITVPLRGHVVDVDFPLRYKQWLGTDLRKLVDAEIMYNDSEKQIMDFLRELAPKIEEVIIATDNDREGESIGFEAINALIENNPKIKVTRALFSAITQKDIEDAFSKLEKADKNLADAADSRREIDLAWGAVLTRFLSLISGRLGKAFLSTGRVQGPTLALIVDREKERLAFNPKSYWELLAEFEKDGKKFEASHKNGRFWDKGEAEKAFACKSPPKGIVESVSKKKRVLKRPLPFNTTSFLAAATAIGFTAGRAMRIAESLYQSGFISYPRTDNMEYSSTLDLRSVLKELAKLAEFKSAAENLLALAKLRPSAGKSTKDHPPIHPVAAAANEKLSAEQWKIYELVCRRFLATLSEDAITDNLSVQINLNKQPFVATGQSFVKKGWKEVYPYSKAIEVFLPVLAKGDMVALIDLKMLSKQTMPKPRFSQGALIKLMAELNLGTKSTRADIIQKLFARDYISGGNSIEPNKIAFAVIDSLEKYSPVIAKPDMTARLEKEMDLIAAGKKNKPEVVGESRKALGSALEQLLEHKNNIGTELRKAAMADSIMGKCPAPGCGGDLVIRKARISGKRFLGCSNYPKCTQTFPLPQKGQVASLDEKCGQCGNLMIYIKAGRRSFKMCVNPDCASKDEWKKRAKAKMEKKQREGE